MYVHIKAYLIIMWIRAVQAVKGLPGSLRRFARDESGMGTLEVIIIIAVLVALALLFRDFIMETAELIFEKIKAKSDSIVDTL